MLDYKRIGRFSEQIERYFAQFPRDQMRIFHMREWTANTRETYLEILNLLGLQDDGRIDFPRVNEAHRHRYDRIANFVRNPPPSIAAIVRLLRRIVRQPGLGVGELLLTLNQRAGAMTRVGDSLRAEIRDYYREEAERLSDLLAGRLPAPSAASGPEPIRKRPQPSDKTPDAGPSDRFG